MNTTFQLWPAIDLIDGKPVRLLQGNYAQKTEYALPLQDVSKAFSRFATGIHVVDLDGAKAKKPVNLRALQSIVESSSIPVECGGGIRTIQDIETLLALGVSRVILGSTAIDNPDFFREAMRLFGSQKIVLGVDARDGFVATHGWQKTSKIRSEALLKKLSEETDLQTIIFTDIATDGTLVGPPLETLRTLREYFPELEIIASGGIAGQEDFVKVQETGVAGAIFGKALYEGRLPSLFSPK